MRITLGQLKNSEQALVALSNCTLPISMAFKISKALKVIASELTELEEFRKKLVQKYGSEVDGNLVVSNENIDAFMQEFTPLLSEEIEIPFEPIPIESIPETVNLTPIQLSQLSFFISE